MKPAWKKSPSRRRSTPFLTTSWMWTAATLKLIFRQTCRESRYPSPYVSISTPRLTLFSTDDSDFRSRLGFLPARVRSPRRSAPRKCLLTYLSPIPSPRRHRITSQRPHPSRPANRSRLRVPAQCPLRSLKARPCPLQIQLRLPNRCRSPNGPQRPPRFLSLSPNPVRFQDLFP